MIFMKKFLPLLLVACLHAEEKVDLNVVHQIRTEAFERSKVSEHVFYLADYYGPLVANSGNFHEAADWAVKRLQEYGLTGVKKEPWGPFGRGWQNEYFSAHMIEPRYQPLVGFSLAYTPGTNGAMTAEAVLAPLSSEADFEKYKGKLKGKIVLYETPRVVSATPAGGSVQSAEARSGRYSDADLDQLAKAPEPSTQPRGPAEYLKMREFRNKLNKFLLEEGVAAAVTSGRNGDSGTVFGSQGGSHDPKNPIPPPMVVVTAEHYNRMARLIEKKMPVKLQLEIRNKITDSSLDSLNVIAELPGGRKKDEVVMLGGHMDSWQGGTGATDNASGAAVVMEAVRILKALNLKLDRTVRVALWSAEEQGLLGSRAYVKEHFADREKMVPKPEHAKLAAYFNYDNGSGKIRGDIPPGQQYGAPDL